MCGVDIFPIFDYVKYNRSLQKEAEMPNQNIRVAIVLNGNARGVTSDVINELRRHITDEKIYVSSSLEHAKEIAKKIVAAKFDVVMFGGGDGTFGAGISNIISLKPNKIPAFGVLRLGTGNAMAEALGVVPYETSLFVVKGIEEELAQAKNPAARIDQMILKIGNAYGPFAGMGLDADILRDYRAIKKMLDKIPFLPKKSRGPADYALAITAWSFWRYAANPFIQIVIRNGAKKAYRIDRLGRPQSTVFGPGEILYRGPASIAFASTIPYYGWGFKVCPQANSFLMNVRFQLRISAMDVWETLYSLPAIFSGNLEHPKLWDFACQDITIETLKTPENKRYAKGAPFQISGDLQNKQSKVRIEVEAIRAVKGSATASPDPQNKETENKKTAT
ncbi:MAG: diacylglycerol kinase family protein [bacterium]